jgi:hypothetical protein
MESTLSEQIQATIDALALAHIGRAHLTDDEKEARASWP